MIDLIELNTCLAGVEYGEYMDPKDNDDLIKLIVDFAVDITHCNGFIEASILNNGCYNDAKSKELAIAVADCIVNHIQSGSCPCFIRK